MTSGRGSEKDDAGFLAGPGERRVLGEKAVTRVYGIGPALLGSVDDPVDAEIALGGRGRSHGIGVIGILDVERLAVGFGVDPDALDVQLAARPYDADGDLATVGYPGFV